MRDIGFRLALRWPGKTYGASPLMPECDDLGRVVNRGLARRTLSSWRFYTGGFLDGLDEPQTLAYARYVGPKAMLHDRLSRIRTTPCESSQYSRLRPTTAYGRYHRLRDVARQAFDAPRSVDSRSVMRVGRRYGRSAMLAIDWTVGGTVFEI